jgi:hypothetical protein
MTAMATIEKTVCIILQTACVLARSSSATAVLTRHHQTRVHLTNLSFDRCPEHGLVNPAAVSVRPIATTKPTQQRHTRALQLTHVNVVGMSANAPLTTIVLQLIDMQKQEAP